MTLMKENQRGYRGYPNIRFGGKVLVVINGKTRCLAERWKGRAASTAKRNLYRFCHGCLWWCMPNGVVKVDQRWKDDWNTSGCPPTGSQLGFHFSKQGNWQGSKGHRGDAVHVCGKKNPADWSAEKGANRAGTRNQAGFCKGSFIHRLRQRERDWLPEKMVFPPDCLRIIKRNYRCSFS